MSNLNEIVKLRLVHSKKFARAFGLEEEIRSWELPSNITFEMAQKVLMQYSRTLNSLGQTKYLNQFQEELKQK